MNGLTGSTNRSTQHTNAPTFIKNYNLLER